MCVCVSECACVIVGVFMDVVNYSVISLHMHARTHVHTHTYTHTHTRTSSCAICIMTYRILTSRFASKKVLAWAEVITGHCNGCVVGEGLFLKNQKKGKWGHTAFL